jgi:hypothetical protein
MGAGELHMVARSVRATGPDLGLGHSSCG